jgi:hypothetical protein
MRKLLPESVLVSTFLIGALTFVFRLEATGRAAVPESLSVRPQPAEVEAIIQALETKAASASGTWQLALGRKDKPAEPWTLGLGGGAWYLQSGAKNPAQSAGFSVYSDGEDDFILPDANAAHGGGSRFQIDTLLQGTFFAGREYQLGLLLFHVNAMPRQFLGALGSLTIVGAEDAGGKRLIHLRADPSTDVAFTTDPAFVGPVGMVAGAPRLPRLDFYYDAAARAIVKIQATKDARGPFEVHVEGWQSLGGADQWPQSIVGSPLAIPGTPAGIAREQPFLVSVVSFKAGAAAVTLKELKAKVEQQEFFVTPPQALRSVAFYRQALGKNSSLSDVVALAEANFLSGKGTFEALQAWQQAEGRLRAEEAKQRLARTLAPLAAGAINAASNDKSQLVACAQVLARLTELPNDFAFEPMSADLCAAWQRLRKNPETAVATSRMNANLLGRFVSQGNVFVLQDLIKSVNNDPADGALIEPYLARILERPVPKAGLYQSQQEYLLVATVRLGDWNRAKACIARIKWLDTVSPSDKQAIALWSRTIDTVERLGHNDDQAILAAIELSNSFSSPESKSNPTNQFYGPWVLANSAVDFIQAHVNRRDEAPEDMLRRSAKVEGAKVFWDRVIRQFSVSKLLDPSEVSSEAWPLMQAYAIAFSDPQYETKLWLQLGMNSKLRGRLLAVQIAYLNKALASAPDDAARLDAISMLGTAYVLSREYARGAQAVEQASSLIQDPAVKTKAVTIVRSLQARAAKEFRTATSAIQ